MYVEAADKAVRQTLNQPSIARSENTKKTESRKQEIYQEKAVELELSKNRQNEKNKQTRMEIQEEKDAMYEKQLENAQEILPHSEAKYGVHEPTNRITITLVDKNTKEVIKEIPPEKNLDLLAKSKEIAGVLMDERL